MARRILICPICGDKSKVEVKRAQKNRRCENCQRLIRVIAPKRKTKKSKNKKR